MDSALGQRCRSDGEIAVVIVNNPGQRPVVACPSGAEGYLKLRSPG